MHSIFSPRDSENFPFVLLGNKIDNEEARTVSAKRAQSWCQTKGEMPYFEVSAKEALNVEDAFQAIARAALKRDAQDASDFPDFNEHITLDQTRDTSSNQGCACWIFMYFQCVLMMIHLHL